MQSIPIHYERPALFDLGEPLPFRFVYTGIRVRDMDESIRFYTQVLGMTLVERMTTARTKGEVATLRSPGSEQELELNFYEEGSPFWAPYSNGEDLEIGRAHV